MALLEAITCGNTEIPAHDIRIAVKKLAAVNPKTKVSGLASEYQVGVAVKCILLRKGGGYHPRCSPFFGVGAQHERLNCR